MYDVPSWTRIDGAVAVVTGGARGFGRAVVLSLVDAGARVVIADLDAAHAQVAERDEK
jgi:NAD(P)-dependent dehydrogenase (short-subunit alcohol dehydrogenase family)